MPLFRPGETGGDLLAMETERVRSLLTDMDRILGGHRPETIANADAPILDQWNPINRPASCLVGLSTGHPKLPGTNREIVTSDVWLVSDDLTWVRTLSRWYRLGRPAFRTVDA